MTIAQRKIALINWITELDDEGLIRYLEDIQNRSIKDLPKEITELLHLSDAASQSELTEHTDSRTILGKK